MLRTLMPLFSALTPLIIGVSAIQAAYLNDIRVGEYGTHTRIVFELSEPAAFERIISGKPGQLTIIFANTQPQLIRKIPYERTKRVQTVKLLRRQDSLSSIFTFSFDQFRYELMEFKNPFRIVVDVYHLATNLQPPLLPELTLEQATAFDAGQTQGQPSDGPANVAPLTPLLSEKVAAARPANVQLSDATRQAQSPQAKTEKQMAAQSSKLPTLIKVPNNSKDTPSNAKGLQYYLVVGMVIMTIVILILLLLMLIFKQPKRDDKVFQASNDLHNQDRRIAALNAKIHEQLKRYDEA